MGRWEVEINGPLKADDYYSGRVFLAQSITADSNHAPTKRRKKKEGCEYNRI